ncbi:MAG TPA: class I SAM-dependent methyltransferase [Candidatus Acidoferrum sp.]|nr:class I SAM-dependent methyltransferase [Candidatus Acidoferrum sp.]
MAEKSHSKLVRIVTGPLRSAKHFYSRPSLRQQYLELNHYVHVLLEEVSALKKQHEEGQASSNHRLQLLDDRLTDTVHQLTILEETSHQPIKSTKEEKTSGRLMAHEHLLDKFYVEFEHWFRGTEEELAKRQSVYLPYFTESKIDSKKYPVVDIGCGNGEFVGVLGEHGIRAIGLDLNKTMIERVKEKGLEGIQDDALSYLRTLPSSSIMAITGFHIVEHIPFLDLVLVFNECYRVLRPGGFVLFETPNPENVIVGTCNFYNDPSHLHPLPPGFLEFVLKTRGFQKTEVKRLHPIKKDIQSSDPLAQEMAERFFGPQDYAVIAHK